MGIYIKALLLFIFLPNAEQAEPLEGLLQQITEQVSEVKTEKYTYTQQFEYNKEQPYQINLRLIETSNKKRNSKTFLYQFNLGDIEPHQVHRKADKVMKVLLRTVRSQPLIKVFEEGEQQNYEKELILYCDNVEVARELEALIKEAIPLAYAAWEKEIHLPTDRGGLMNWLKEQISTIEVGKESIRQKLEISEEYPDRIRMQVDKTDSKGNTATFIQNWSFGDIHSPSLKMNIKGKQVFVEAKTRRNLDYIQLSKEDGSNSFDNRFQIYAENPDKAKILLLAIDKLLPLAEEALKQRLPKAITKEKALEGLTAVVQSFNDGKNSYEQSIQADCQTQYIISKQSEKNSNSRTYLFHFEDLNKSAIKIKVGKSTIEIGTSTTQKQKLIQLSEGDKSKFQGNLSFIVPDVETARKMEYFLAAVIDYCPQEIHPQSFEWLAEEVKTVFFQDKEISQSLQLTDGNTCQLIYQRTEAGKKDILEENYELNWSDINENEIALTIDKNQPAINLEAVYKEKIFKYYNSKDKMDYRNEFTVFVKDIQTGKLAVKTVKDLVKRCRQ